MKCIHRLSYYLKLVPFSVLVLMLFLKTQLVLFRLLGCFWDRKFKDNYFNPQLSSLLSTVNGLHFQGGLLWGRVSLALLTLLGWQGAILYILEY